MTDHLEERLKKILQVGNEQEVEIRRKREAAKAIEDEKREAKRRVEDAWKGTYLPSLLAAAEILNARLRQSEMPAIELRVPGRNPNDRAEIVITSMVPGRTLWSAISLSAKDMHFHHRRQFAQPTHERHTIPAGYHSVSLVDFGQDEAVAALLGVLEAYTGTGNG